MKHIIFFISILFLPLSIKSQSVWYTGQNKGLLVVDNYIVNIIKDTAFLEHFNEISGVMSQSIIDTLIRDVSSKCFRGKCFLIKNLSEKKMNLVSKVECKYKLDINIYNNVEFNIKKL